MTNSKAPRKPRAPRKSTGMSKKDGRDAKESRRRLKARVMALTAQLSTLESLVSRLIDHIGYDPNEIMDARRAFEAEDRRELEEE